MTADTPCDGGRLRELFSARSRDVTPASLLCAARVLYTPVSDAHELNHGCASVLSASELQRAERFVSPHDKSLFIQRRAFRRFCAAQSLDFSGSLSQLVFEETDGGRPYLADCPDLWFSFSSCRFGLLGGWSSSHGIGVDIEDRTRNPAAAELANHYFSAAEAGALETAGGQIDPQAFFRLWCLKEAALKSIGQGLPFGLDAFKFALDPGPHVVDAPRAYGGPEDFSGHLMEWPESCAAIVIRSNPITDRVC